MTERPLRVALIGLGAIGADVAQRAANEPNIELVSALVRDPEKPRPDQAPPVVTALDELLATEPDVVVELAGHDALRAYGPAVLRSGHDLLFVAVGALADPDTERELRTAAAESGQRAQAISGAIGALDAISAAGIGKLDRVTHTTRKPPTTLLGEEEGAKVTEPRVMFEGTAREGALQFPESVNVAAAVSLAGAGLDETTLLVIADPAVDRNQHEVEAEGEFGRLRFEIAGYPSADNPKTGRLVAMSVIRALRGLHPGVFIG